MFGFLKAILIVWIAIVVVRWYRRLEAGRRNDDISDAPRTAPPIDHSGRIEDAEFEDMDDKRPTSG